MVAVDPASPERIFAAGGSGLWRTRDGGTVWTHQPSFLTITPTRTHVFGIEASKQAPGTLFVLTAAGVLQTLFLTEHRLRPGILRSRNLGSTWELVTQGIELPGVRRLLIDPTDPSVVFAATGPEPGTPAGPRFLVSEDGGDTWAFLEGSLPAGVSVTELEIDLRRPELLYAATTSGVYRAVPGRSEVFIRIVGPRPNGFLWPTLVKLGTSTVEVWIEQTSSGILRYYRLEGASPGTEALPGLFDRTGFLP